MNESIPGEKISIVTDEISQDLDTVAKFLDEYNLNTIELRMVEGKRVPNLDKDVWDKLKALVKEKNWNVLALSPGTFKGHYTDKPNIHNEVFTVMQETIVAAKEIGASNIITFGFMADQDDPIPDYILKVLSTSAGFCESAGIKLLLENEPGSFADSGERTKILLEKVNHPNLYVNWDPCNSNVFDNATGLTNGVNAISGYMQHVHVKDAAELSDGLFPKYGAISSGHVGWRAHLLAIKELNYTGYFGIETHYEPLWDSSAIILTEFRDLMKEINFWN